MNENSRDWVRTTKNAVHVYVIIQNNPARLSFDFQKLSGFIAQVVSRSTAKLSLKLVDTLDPDRIEGYGKR